MTSFREKCQRIQQRSEHLAQQFNVLLEQDQAQFRFRKCYTEQMCLHIFIPGHARDQWEIRNVNSERIPEGEEEAYYHSHFQKWQEAFEKRLTEEESDDAFYGDSSGYNFFGGHHQ